jgi:hypothetical protein
VKQAAGWSRSPSDRRQGRSSRPQERPAFRWSGKKGFEPAGTPKRKHLTMHAVSRNAPVYQRFPALCVSTAAVMS